jgi:hypothetical protein
LAVEASDDAEDGDECLLPSSDHDGGDDSDIDPNYSEGEEGRALKKRGRQLGVDGSRGDDVGSDGSVGEGEASGGPQVNDDQSGDSSAGEDGGPDGDEGWEEGTHEGLVSVLRDMAERAVNKQNGREQVEQLETALGRPVLGKSSVWAPWLPDARHSNAAAGRAGTSQGVRVEGLGEGSVLRPEAKTAVAVGVENCGILDGRYGVVAGAGVAADAGLPLSVQQVLKVAAAHGVRDQVLQRAADRLARLFRC